MTGSCNRWTGAASARSARRVDRYEADSNSGWSVLVKGRAELSDKDDVLHIRLQTTGLEPWRNRVPRPEWVVIRPDIVTGRRL